MVSQRLTCSLIVLVAGRYRYRDARDPFFCDVFTDRRCGVAMDEQRLTGVTTVSSAIWISTVAAFAVFIAFRESTAPKLILGICVFCCGVALIWDNRK